MMYRHYYWRLLFIFQEKLLRCCDGKNIECSKEIWLTERRKFYVGINDSDYSILSSIYEIFLCTYIKELNNMKILCKALNDILWRHLFKLSIIGLKDLKPWKFWVLRIIFSIIRIQNSLPTYLLSNSSNFHF